MSNFNAFYTFDSLNSLKLNFSIQDISALPKPFNFCYSKQILAYPSVWAAYQQWQCRTSRHQRHEWVTALQIKVTFSYNIIKLAAVTRDAKHKQVWGASWYHCDYIWLWDSSIFWFANPLRMAWHLHCYALSSLQTMRWNRS